MKVIAKVDPEITITLSSREAEYLKEILYNITWGLKGISGFAQELTSKLNNLDVANLSSSVTFHEYDSEIEITILNEGPQ